MAPSLQQVIANGSAIGAQAILVFIGDPDAESPFVVPIRLAHIVEAKSVGDIFVLKLRVGPYPDLEGSPLTRADIERASATFRDKLIEANGQYYPAVVRFPRLQVTFDGDSAQKWQAIARRLARHSAFEDSDFVRIDEPLLASGQKAALDPDGRLRLGEGKSARIPVSFYTERYSDELRNTLSCTTDSAFLRIASGDSYDVALRYDSVEFWLQPVMQSFDTLTLVTIRMANNAPGQAELAALTTTAQFPVITRRSRPRLAMRVLVTSVGAFLVALPAIVGEGSPLRLRILSAVIGAVLLSSMTVLSRRS